MLVFVGVGYVRGINRFREGNVGMCGSACLLFRRVLAFWLGWSVWPGSGLSVVVGARVGFRWSWLCQGYQ